MSKHRTEIAIQVTKSLRASEDAIDMALAQVAKFVAEMPAARMEARFAAAVGQDALAQAIAALTSLSEAREAMVKAHDALADVRDEFQIGPVGYGVDPNKPTREFARRGAPLKAVA
jgi:histidyl-tRNA synthetase